MVVPFSEDHFDRGQTDSADYRRAGIFRGVIISWTAGGRTFVDLLFGSLLPMVLTPSMGKMFVDWVLATKTTKL